MQNLSIFGSGRKLKNTVWPKTAEQRPDGERKIGAKVENRGFEKSGGAPKHRQNKVFFGAGKIQKNKVWQAMPGTLGPKLCLQFSLKVWDTYFSQMPAAAPASQGGCLGRPGRPNVEAGAPKGDTNW